MGAFFDNVEIDVLILVFHGLPVAPGYACFAGHLTESNEYNFLRVVIAEPISLLGICVEGTHRARQLEPMIPHAL